MTQAKLLGMHIGQRVRYRTVSLWRYTGWITAMTATPHGGDCMVQWAHMPTSGATEECLSNLEPV